MSKWYIAKKKIEKRWRAYELEKKPELKSGYEMKGPYKNFVECLIAANKPPKSIEGLRAGRGRHERAI